MKAYFLWLAKFLTVLIAFFVLVPLIFVVLIAGIISFGATADLEGADPAKTVAVIELKDEIKDAKEVVKNLHRQAENDKVKGIVLRIDSPGGAVAPSQEIYSTVLKLKAKKPIVVSMGELAASGGLYSALGASKIFAQPGTLSGSIGVIMQVPDFHLVGEKLGVAMNTVKSGPFKDSPSPFREFTETDRQYLQGLIGVTYEEFVRAVSEGRNIPIDKVKTFADGRIILGSQAKELGLVDELGDVYDAGRAVFDLLGTPLPAGEYPTLYYPEDNLPEFLRNMTEVLSDLRFRISGRSRLMFMAP